MSFNKDKQPIGARSFTLFQDGGFELNEYGYIRNDISQLLQAQNRLSFERAIAQFKRNTIESNIDTTGMTDEDIIKQTRPRWCQLPFQLRAFAEYLTDMKVNEIRKDIDKIAERQKKLEVAKQPSEQQVIESVE